MNIDNNNLIFFDKTSKGQEIKFENTQAKKPKQEKSKFYEVLEHPEYIIKYSQKKLKDYDIYKMLTIFSKLKEKITSTDLPIAHYQEDNILKGIVVPYYNDSVSLYQITSTKNLNELTKYYHHDDDKLHNLYLLLNDALNILEELQNNNICYIDSNPGNFILKDNQVKLIDFEPNYLKYGLTNENIKILLERYDDLICNSHLYFQLDNLPIYKAKNFKIMRNHLIKLENKTRKRILTKR